jgi:flagellar basal-body rod modification protein FlgD
MAIVQQIENGKVVENTTTTSRTSDSTSGNTYDKEMFLQLLVAEMQYQDPLEPTSNTEYVSELASFSQIEAVQAVQDKMTTLEANSLVGKYVILNTTDASGNQTWVSGKVDFVQTDDDGNMFLSVNDALYSIDDLDSVADEEYYNGVTNAQVFNQLVQALPTEAGLSIQDEDKLTAARSLLDSMSTYQLQFVSEDDVNTLTTLENRLEALKKALASNQGNQDTTEDVTDTTEETEDVAGTEE